MRVSDAERAQIADRLGRHYGAGRLDQAEFEERLERAMNAKTWGDFDGLFADLPDTEPPSAEPGPSDAPAPPAPPPRTAVSRRPLLLAALIIALAVAIGPHLAWWPGFGWFFFPPWLIIAIVALIVVRTTRRRRGRF